MHSQVHVFAENTTTFATLCPFADLQLFYMSFFVYLHSIFVFIFILHLSHLVRNYAALTYVLLLRQKKHILSGLSCKYSNPNGSSPKSRRKNVCRLPNPNRQVRKGLGATNIHSHVPLRLPTTRRLTQMSNEWLCLPGGSRN